MQGKLNVLDSSGHGEIVFDVDLDTPEAKAAIASAESIIRGALAKKSLVTARVNGEDVRVKTFFDDLLKQAEEVTVVPQIVGG